MAPKSAIIKVLDMAEAGYSKPEARLLLANDGYKKSRISQLMKHWPEEVNQEEAAADPPNTQPQVAAEDHPLLEALAEPGVAAEAGPVHEAAEEPGVKNDKKGKQKKAKDKKDKGKKAKDKKDKGKKDKGKKDKGKKFKDKKDNFKTETNYGRYSYCPVTKSFIDKVGDAVLVHAPYQ